MKCTLKTKEKERTDLKGIFMYILIARFFHVRTHTVVLQLLSCFFIVAIGGNVAAAATAMVIIIIIGVVAVVVITFHMHQCCRCSHQHRSFSFVFFFSRTFIYTGDTTYRVHILHQHFNDHRTIQTIDQRSPFEYERHNLFYYTFHSF